jgi:hypothetical protein
MLKTVYLTKWVDRNPLNERCSDCSFLSPCGSRCGRLFDWQREAGRRNFSYTGLLVKQSGKWRIRLEDESGAPTKLPQQERKAITLDSAILEQYVGQYQLSPNLIMTVTNENGKLMTQASGQPKVEIFAESETKFFVKAFDAQITFVKDTQGRITNMILHQRGRDTSAQKIK